MYNTEEDEDQGGEIFPEAIALVERKFTDDLKKWKKNWSINVPDKRSDIIPLNKRKNHFKDKKGK